MDDRTIEALASGELDDDLGPEPAFITVPVEPTEAMLNAARDWSLKKYGKPIGSDDARGCWEAMLRAAMSR